MNAEILSTQHQPHALTHWPCVLECRVNVKWMLFDVHKAQRYLLFSTAPYFESGWQRLETFLTCKHESSSHHFSFFCRCSANFIRTVHSAHSPISVSITRIHRSDKESERTGISSIGRVRIISRSAAEGLISKLNTEFESKVEEKKKNIQVKHEQFDFKFSLELVKVFTPGAEQFHLVETTCFSKAGNREEEY